MKSKHDRTGVMRRQLFQVVAFDLRLTDEASAVAAPAPQGRAQLAGLAAAGLRRRRSEPLCGASLRSVAVWDEVVEVADQIPQMCDMKFLERRRFLGRVQ